MPLLSSTGGSTHLPSPLPRPPFFVPKWGRGGEVLQGERLDSVPSQPQRLLGSTNTHTDLRGRRGLTFFCFSPRPKGDRHMVSGQAKRTRTRRTWADTGSGHVRAARHRRAQIPSYHSDRRPRCRNQPVFLDPRHTRHRHSPLFCLCVPFLGYQRRSASSLEGYCLFLSLFP